MFVYNIHIYIYTVAVSLSIPQEAVNQVRLVESMAPKIEVKSKSYSCSPAIRAPGPKLNVHASLHHASYSRYAAKVCLWNLLSQKHLVPQSNAPRLFEFLPIYIAVVYLNISKSMYESYPDNQLIEWISHEWQCLNHNFLTFYDQDSHGAS